MNIALLLILVILFLAIIVVSFWYFNPKTPPNLGVTQYTIQTPANQFPNKTTTNQFSSPIGVVPPTQTNLVPFKDDTHLFSKSKNTFEFDDDNKEIYKSMRQDFDISEEMNQKSNPFDLELLKEKSHKSNGSFKMNKEKKQRGNRDNNLEISKEKQRRNGQDNLDISRKGRQRENKNNNLEISKEKQRRNGQDNLDISREIKYESGGNDLEISNKTSKRQQSQMSISKSNNIKNSPNILYNQMENIIDDYDDGIGGNLDISNENTQKSNKIGGNLDISKEGSGDLIEEKFKVSNMIDLESGLREVLPENPKPTLPVLPVVYPNMATFNKSDFISQALPENLDSIANSYEPQLNILIDHSYNMKTENKRQNFNYNKNIESKTDFDFFD